MCRLCKNVEVVSLCRSVGQAIDRQRLTREKQNPTGRTLCSQKNRKVDSVHEGKNNVNDGQVRQPFSDDLKCLLCGVSTAGLIATCQKNQSQRISDRSLVIDDQDPMTVVVHCGSPF